MKVSLEHRLQWAGPGRQVGVFSLLDFERRGGQQLAERAIDLLQRCEAACTAA